MRCIVRDKKTGLFYAKKSQYSKPYYMTKDVNKARIFRNKAGALMSLGKDQPSGKRTAYGGNIWEYIWPDTMEIIPINIETHRNLL